MSTQEVHPAYFKNSVILKLRSLLSHQNEIQNNSCSPIDHTIKTFQASQGNRHERKQFRKSTLPPQHQ
jgi:hypothetical protein